MSKAVNGVAIIVIVVLIWELLMFIQTSEVFFWYESKKRLPKNVVIYMATYIQGTPTILLFATVIVVQDYMMKLYRAMIEN